MRIEFDGLAWPAGLAVLALVLLGLRRRGRVYALFFSVFWAYLLVLVSVTVFPIPLGMGAGVQYPTLWAQIAGMFRYSGLNLLPFYFGNCWELPQACAAGIRENIIMTMPFGFGICFLARLRPRDIAWLAVGLGVLIESTQFALDVVFGGTYRSVDANDVVFNGLGVWLGYGLFLVFAWLVTRLTRRWKPGGLGVLAFIRQACQAGLAGISGAAAAEELPG